VIWDSVLKALGSVLSFFYEVIPSYGVAIILLTVLVRLLLLPLTIRQTRSMQAMQSLQPKVKELQRKYKGNRQKLQEETMKLYKEHQVNPLGGCLPLVLQLPVFFALFAVLRTPVQAVATAEEFAANSLPKESVCLTSPEARAEGPSPDLIVCDTGNESRTFAVSEWLNKDTGASIESELPYMRFCEPVEADPQAGLPEDGFLCSSALGAQHVPRESQLFGAIVEDRATFLGMHLSCSPTQAASEENVRLCAGPGTAAGVVPAIPYFIMVALMVGTTYYQQRQMQKASAGPAQQQQQLMGRIMPVFLGFISINISAGVLVYWVTTNAWQIGQQYLMLRRRSQAEALPAKGSTKDSSPPKGSGPAKGSDKTGETPKPSKAVEGDGSKAKGSGGRRAGSRRKRRKR
jgi:YidC/Oxa1 family membrane protein insertase